jgi:hypothetical protein
MQTANPPTGGIAVMPPPTTTRKLILNVTPEALDQLQALAAKKGRGKVSEVIRQAIAIYVRIVEEQHDDPNISVELVSKKNGTRAKLVLPFS